MLVLGLMSGTSADGIDAALCEITGAPPAVQARVVAAVAVPHPPEMRARILAAFAPETGRVDEICRLNVALAEAFASAALRLLDAAHVAPDDVALVGSHGQTVWHDIRPDGSAYATLQLGEAGVIAERTGITTITGFRPRDIAAGGQGAPLTAYADWLLLRHPEQWRAVQNIGGIGNVTFLPPLSDTTSEPIAFDTGPGNALIDAAIHLLTDGALAYDHNGEIAASGLVHQDWLESLMQHPYFDRTPPKTTGRELFSNALARSHIESAAARGIFPEDMVASLTALTARSIADAYKRYAPAPISEVIVGGGGARNPVLMAMLRAMLKPVPVRTHEQIGIDSDFKEALAFALLAYETWHNRPATLPSLTGAQHASVLGAITPGKNYAALLRETWAAGSA